MGRKYQNTGYHPQGYYSQSNAAQSGTNEKRRMVVNPLRLSLLIICVAAFTFCTVTLISYFVDVIHSRHVSSEMIKKAETTIEDSASEVSAQSISVVREKESDSNWSAPVAMIATPTPSVIEQPPTVEEIWPEVYPKNKDLRISAFVYELQSQNKDAVGYLNIDGLISEPVVQRDNVYYLTHNSKGQSSRTGAIFLDENCDLTEVPTQMVLHGHNMKEGSMFGAIKKYKVKGAEFYREHPYIDFNTMYENARYVIFALCEVDIRDGYLNYLPYCNYPRFFSEKEFLDYVSKIKSYSQLQSEIEVKPGDRLLTLSTCTGNDSNKRFIVVARKIRDNESDFELNIGIMSSSDKK